MNPPQNWPKIWQLAKSYRKPITASSQEELNKNRETFLQEIEEELKAEVPHLGNYSDLLALAPAFEGASLLPGPFQLHTLLDSSANPIAKIKVFPNPFSYEGQFLSALSAHAALAPYSFKTLHPLQPTKIALATLKGELVALASYPFAQGLDLQEVSQKENAKQAFSCLGKALGELHGCCQKKEQPLPPQQAFFFKDIYNHAYPYLKEEFGKQIQQLDFAFQSLLLKMKKEPFTLCLTHNDLHLGQFLYHDNSIHMLDFSTLHNSIDEKDQPLGLAAFDYVHLFDALDASNMELPLKKELGACFDQAYLQEGGIAPSYLELNFFRLFSPIHYLSYYGYRQEGSIDPKYLKSLLGSKKAMIVELLGL